jgi:hypothetical protein
MAVVTDISKRAKQALIEKGIRHEYGYGDAYHFRGLPGTSSVDIDSAFALGEVAFVVVGERLLLADEQARETLKQQDLWQSIETAPFSERVLVFVPIKHHRLVIAMKIAHSGTWLQEDYQPMPFPPSHWMPLPAPPVDAYV